MRLRSNFRLQTYRRVQTDSIDRSTRTAKELIVAYWQYANCQNVKLNITSNKKDLVPSKPFF